MMRIVLLHILLLGFFVLNGQDTGMDLISEFDKVMDDFNEAYTNAESAEEAELIAEKYDVLISQAEAKLEAGFETMFKEQEEQLLKEQNDILIVIDEEQEEETTTPEVTLTEKSQSIMDDIIAGMETDVIAKRYYIKHYKQFALEINYSLTSSNEADIIEELKVWYNNK